FLSMTRRPPSSTLLPYTTLFRSVLVQEAHRALVQVQRALDPAAAGLAHAAPVLERVADQLLGRDRGDGLVPVLHRHRVQRDVDRSEEHTSELQSRENLVCRLLLE